MSSGPKKFLAPEVLAEAVAQVAELAKRERVSILLIGGFAMQHYGSDRLTGDVDFAATDRLDALPRGPALSFGGEQTHAPNGVPVDLVLRNDEFASLYEEAIARGVKPRGMPVPIVRPEHLAAMKMVAGRSRDTLDLEFLVASHAVAPTKARKVILKHLGPYAAREFDRFVEEVAWKASKGRL